MRWWYWLLVALAVGLVIAAVVLAWEDSTRSNPGEWGDFWGGHFSAAGALAGAVLFFLAIMLQRDELAAQREELRLAREISTKQAEELEKQTIIAERSANMGHIIQLQNYRSNLELKIARYKRVPGDIAKDVRYTALDLHQKTDEYLAYLLRSPVLTETERKLLVDAAGFQLIPKGESQ